MNFKDFLDIPQSGVYALINETDRKIYITYSNYIFGSLSRIIRELKNDMFVPKELVDNVDDLEFRVLEQCWDLPNQKLRATFYMREFKKAGYTLFKEVKFVEYTVRKTVGADWRKIYKNLVYVQLVANCNAKLTVAVFPKMEQAEEFIKKYYENGVNRIVYGENQLSRDYLNRSKA